MAIKTEERAPKSTRQKKQVSKKPSGSPSQAVSSNGSKVSNSSSLRQLYESLLRCRLVLEQARDWKLPEYGSAVGEEAMAVGPTAELHAEDTMTASSRNLAAFVARGLPLNHLLGESSASPTPSSLRNSFPQDPFNLGTGIALAHKLTQKQQVVIAFCPEECPALESWHEALKFAGVHKLPIVFVIKNGVADQRSSKEHAPHLEVFSFMARDYGYPGIIVDGQDVVAVWRVAQEAIHRARTGAGPTLIDCRTDPARDPLLYMEHYMKKRNVWDQEWKLTTEEQIKDEIEKASPLVLS